MLGLASFKARIFHDGQISGASLATCSRCLETGHHASTCVKPFVCKRCKGTGHKSYECEASRDQTPSVGTTGEHEPKNGERPSGTESSVNTSHTTRVVNTAVEKNVNNTSSLAQKDVNSRTTHDERSKTTKSDGSLVKEHTCQCKSKLGSRGTAITLTDMNQPTTDQQMRRATKIRNEKIDKKEKGEERVQTKNSSGNYTHQKKIEETKEKPVYI